MSSLLAQFEATERYYLDAKKVKSSAAGHLMFQVISPEYNEDITRRQVEKLVKDNKQQATTFSEAMREWKDADGEILARAVEIADLITTQLATVEVADLTV
jgi:hypothetical protein